MLPEALVGRCHRGSYLCRDWELRVTTRALEEDLGVRGDADFEDLLNVEIIKSFIKDRFSRTNDTRQVTPLTCGNEVWVLARGDDHRAGTLFDDKQQVVWLVAYGRHRSGSKDDFFPYCKSLDADDRLLPTVDDYERMVVDRDSRFAYAIAIEAPLVLKKARTEGTEQRVMFGGKYGACMAIETADDLESTTVAFRVDTVLFDYVPVILSALHGDGRWELVGRMPSRELEAMEVAYEHLHELRDA
jgi:hypothetical protein